MKALFGDPIATSSVTKDTCDEFTTPQTSQTFWSRYGQVNAPLQDACRTLGDELRLVGLAETTALRHPKQEPLGTC